MHISNFWQYPSSRDYVCRYVWHKYRSSLLYIVGVLCIRLRLDDVAVNNKVLYKVHVYRSYAHTQRREQGSIRLLCRRLTVASYSSSLSSVRSGADRTVT
jgi:hypothetical protein